jgi:hypothetical protein
MDNTVQKSTPFLLRRNTNCFDMCVVSPGGRLDPRPAPGDDGV